MDRVLIVDGDKCTGCRVCELACSMAKTGAYNPYGSLIHVLRNMELDVSIPVVEVSCDCCGRCVDSCFEGAIAFVSWQDAAAIRKAARIGRLPSPMIASRAGLPRGTPKGGEASIE